MDVLTSLTLKSESATASRSTISSARSHRIIRCCLNRRRDPISKTGNAFLRLTFKNSLTYAFYTKTMQMAWEEVAEVSYCYYSWDCMEISLFGSSKVYRSRPDVLGRARGPLRTFSNVGPGKGLSYTCAFDQIENEIELKKNAVGYRLICSQFLMKPVLAGTCFC